MKNNTTANLDHTFVIGRWRTLLEDLSLKCRRKNVQTVM